MVVVRDGKSFLSDDHGVLAQGTIQIPCYLQRVWPHELTWMQLHWHNTTNDGMETQEIIGETLVLYTPALYLLVAGPVVGKHRDIHKPHPQTRELE